MAKAVFRPNEITPVTDKIMLKLSHNFEEEEEKEVEEVEPEYTGPTVEELKAQADEFRAKWELEKQELLDSAKAQADRIVKEAEQAAFEEVKRQTPQGQIQKTTA